jgi:hypothetical protein
VFAPGAQPFFRLELRHAEQMAEYLEPMTLRQLDQFGNGLGNEGHGLVGAALLTSFCSLYGWRFRRFARSLTLPTARTFGQKIFIPTSQNIAQKYPLWRRNSRAHFVAA